MKTVLYERRNYRTTFVQKRDLNKYVTYYRKQIIKYVYKIGQEHMLLIKKIETYDFQYIYIFGKILKSLFDVFIKSNQIRSEFFLSSCIARVYIGFYICIYFNRIRSQTHNTFYMKKCRISLLILRSYYKINTL